MVDGARQNFNGLTGREGRFFQRGKEETMWDIFEWPVFRFPTSRHRQIRASRCIHQNMRRFNSGPDQHRKQRR